MDISLKRIVAYLIDIFIVTLIAGAISSIRILNPYYSDYEKTLTRYNELVEKTDVDKNEVININHDIYKYRTYQTIISVSSLILYFGVFQYSTKGQTIGKRLLKLRIVSNNKKKLNIGNYILRIIILNNIIFTILAFLGVYVLDNNVFYYATLIIGGIQSIILSINILMIVLRRDRRGLHDILSNTTVENVSLDDEIEVIEDERPTKSKANNKKKK